MLYLFCYTEQSLSVGNSAILILKMKKLMLREVGLPTASHSWTEPGIPIPITFTQQANSQAGSEGVGGKDTEGKLIGQCNK